MNRRHLRAGLAARDGTRLLGPELTRLAHTGAGARLAHAVVELTAGWVALAAPAVLHAIGRGHVGREHVTQHLLSLQQ